MKNKVISLIEERIDKMKKSRPDPLCYPTLSECHHARIDELEHIKGLIERLGTAFPPPEKDRCRWCLGKGKRLVNTFDNWVPTGVTENTCVHCNGTGKDLTPDKQHA